MDLCEWSPGTSQRHPWETTRARFFRRVVQGAGLGAAPVAGLDVGSGDGWFARELLAELHPESTLCCWDHGYDDDTLTQLAGHVSPAVRFTRECPQKQFDLLLCMDVLEHVEADGQLLGELVRERLRPGGWALVSVPAWQGLFSSHDARLGHVRRYSPAQARRLVADSGLTLVNAGGLFHSLLVPRLVHRLADSLDRRPAFAHVGEWSAGRSVTRAVEAALAADNRASYLFAQWGLEVPGLSWWGLCRKPS